MLQELFNKSVAGLASQGFEGSYKKKLRGICAYRGDNGRRCAIGWLIPDEVYSPEMEAMDVCDLSDDVIRAITGDPYFHVPDEEVIMDALNELQGCHDIGDTPRDMRRMLRRFAEHYELHLPPELRDQ